MIKYVKGNLLDAKENVIIHGVNCQGVMGSGLAKQIKTKWPEVYKEYKKVCNEHLPEELLGDTLTVKVSESQVVLNLFQQLYYGTGKRQINYSAFCQGLSKIKFSAIRCKMSLAFPKFIGCALAGGDWYIVESLIKDTFENTDIDVTIYSIG